MHDASAPVNHSVQRKPTFLYAAKVTADRGVQSQLAEGNSGVGLLVGCGSILNE